MGSQVFFPFLWENLKYGRKIRYRRKLRRKIKEFKKRKGVRTDCARKESRRGQVRHKSVGTQQMRTDVKQSVSIDYLAGLEK